MMLLLVLLAGIIAGAAAFYPLSSAGCVMLFSTITGLGMDRQLYSMILLGLFAASLIVFLPDVLRLLKALVGITLDLLYNLKVYLTGRRKRSYDYRRVLNGSYRRLLLAILVSLVPALLLGFILRGIVRFANGNLLAVAMGFLVTALLLLVSSFMMTEQMRGPKKLKITDSLIVGVFSGVAFLPGVSKIAATGSSGSLLGLSRRLTVKYAYLLNMFCMLSMLIPGKLTPVFPNGEPHGVFACVIGFLASFFSGMVLLHFAANKLRREKSRMFAACNMGLAVICVVAYLIMR